MLQTAGRSLIGLFFLFLLGWIFHYGNGFIGEATASGGHTVSFNWHAILMSTSFLLLMGEGAFAFRSRTGTRMEVSSPQRAAAKTKHWLLMGLALGTGIVGTIAIFVNHVDHGFPNFYSAPPHPYHIHQVQCLAQKECKSVEVDTPVQMPVSVPQEAQSMHPSNGQDRDT